MELVLPGWFQADVGFLHLLTLRLLDVFVPLSFCTHHLVINIADQLLGSLERKGINTKWMDSHTTREKKGARKSRAALRDVSGWVGCFTILSWETWPKLGTMLSNGREQEPW